MWRPAPSSRRSAAGRCRWSTRARACWPSTPRSARRSGLFDVSHLGKADGHRSGRGRVRQPLPDRRPGQDRARSGPVHPDLQRRRRRRRRPDRLPPLRRRRVPDPQRRQLRRGGRAARRRGARRGRRSTDQHDDFAVLAVQGTALRRGAGRGGLPAGHDYMSFVEVDQSGAPVTVCRTGYTGERGYELVVPAERPGVGLGRGGRGRRAVRAAARPVSAPATRCAPRWATRCTVRTSHPTSLRCRPGSAGRSAGARRPSSATQALRAEKQAGPTRLLRGLQAVGRGIPRPGMVVRDADGAEIGVGHLRARSRPP